MLRQTISFRRLLWQRATSTVWLNCGGRPTTGKSISLHSRALSTAAAAHDALPEQEVKPFSAIPGPKPLPILRNVLEFKRNSARISHYMKECYEKYGKIFKLEMPGGNNFVYMADPNSLENVYRAEGKYPMRENNMSANMQWIYNKLKSPVPVVFRNGEHWKEGRSAISNQTKLKNVQMYTTGLNGVVTRFTEFLTSIRDEDKRVSDIAMPLRRLMVELSAKFVYNTDLHAFDNPSEETEQFIEAINLGFDVLLKMVFEPPLYKLYPNKTYRDMKKVIETTKDFGLKYSERVCQEIKSGKESEVQGLLEQWMREGKMTESEALTMSADMFGAAVDATSSQAAFLLYFMAKNPEAQERLYEEIQSVLGDRTEPTPEDISKMSYLKGCMMESFRILPTGEITSNTRVLAEDVTLMGYHIPAQTNVCYLLCLAGKNEALFPNPEKFDPERWARDKPNPFAILPFGFGSRGCYGKRFAELKLRLLLIQMIRKYVLTTDLEKLNVESVFITRPAGDLPLYLKDRHTL